MKGYFLLKYKTKIEPKRKRNQKKKKVNHMFTRKELASKTTKPLKTRCIQEWYENTSSWELSTSPGEHLAYVAVKTFSSPSRWNSP